MNAAAGRLGLKRAEMVCLSNYLSSVLNSLNTETRDTDSIAGCWASAHAKSGPRS